MKSWKYLAAFMLAGVVSAAEPAPLTFRSSETLVTLLELYTSEGCSSCPPAEAWLAGAKQAPGLWRSFVPVAFHVDYWDDLGWKDAAASPSFSERQRNYARAWRAESVYTPGFVVNGREWRNWGGDINRFASPNTKAGVLEISSGDTNRWQIQFAPATKPVGRHEVHVAILASGLVSDVKAGENRGRKLPHDFTVLSLGKAFLNTKDGVLTGEVAVTTRPTNAGSQLAVAAWVTREGRLEPLQAVGGWLKH